MPVNGYTVGRDVVVDIIGPSGPIRFKVRTGFTAKPMYSSRKVERSDGVIDPLEMPAGWEVELDYERADASVDDYFAEQEAAFHRGENLRPSSITETISEPNGQVSQYRYLNVALRCTDMGQRGAGTDTVKMKISGVAARRVKVV